jgi:UDP-GlcNAc:undecaprenyl-phosphate GlcNAc-1-phosphate transferase
MSFPFNAYLAATLAAMACSAVALPCWRRFCRRFGLVDDPGERKIHDNPMPLAGGLAVMTGIVVPTLAGAAVLWCIGSGSLMRAPAVKAPVAEYGAKELTSLDAYSAYLLQYGLSRRGLELAGILVGALGMLWLGILDDKHELRPAPKFIGQVLIAGLVAGCGVRITLFVPSLWFSFAVTMLWFLAVVNAFNFMDNMNGLCGGLAAIGAWYFALLAAAAQQYLVALIAFLTFGALLGFLPYNFPRARAFLGDSGSHLVGYLLAVLAILPHFYTAQRPRRLAVLIPLLVLAVPLADMAWVVALRWRLGKPFYQGDTNHLSHRLVRRGLSKTLAVLFIWLLAAAVGALACL